jgi:hypothetical protein
MKKTDAKNRQERLAHGENTLRNKNESKDWTDDSTNLNMKEQVMMVSRLRRGTHESMCTRHGKNVITRMPLLWGVAHNRKHTK